MEARRLILLCISLLLSCAALCCGSSREDDLPTPVEMLMAGTAHQTPLYLLDAGKPGPTVFVLAGVHGDEPGSWLAAVELIRNGPPSKGRLIVLPRANRIATEEGVRSTPELGDLNRLYGATSFVLPMAQMAAEIVGLVGRYDVDAVIDLHESWQAYDDRRTGEEGGIDTGYFGQTVSAPASEPSRSLAKAIVQRANSTLSSHEDFRYFEFPEDYEEQVIVPVPADLPLASVPNKSSSYIAEAVPGVASILVEVSQQQPVERRIREMTILVRALLAVL
jgi:hypothetical protein